MAACAVVVASFVAGDRSAAEHGQPLRPGADRNIDLRIRRESDSDFQRGNERDRRRDSPRWRRQPSKQLPAESSSRLWSSFSEGFYVLESRRSSGTGSALARTPARNFLLVTPCFSSPKTNGRAFFSRAGRSSASLTFCGAAFWRCASVGSV